MDRKLIAKAETAANNEHMKTVYQISRVNSNERKCTTTTIREKDGRTLSSQEERKKRWKEHSVKY